MLLSFLRVVFGLMVVAIGLSYAQSDPSHAMIIFFGAVSLALLVVGVEWLVPRKSLAAIAGLFFGLIVGILITYGLSLILVLFADIYPALQSPALIANLKVLIGVIVCYFCVSSILQTKDDIRFVIPYVEFARQIKGQHPLVLDTSVVIDGRIADICETRIIDQRVLVPKFVVAELQAVADSSDKLKRNRGRRGLDVLNKLQNSTKIDIEIFEGAISRAEMSEPVDQKLVLLAKRLNGRLVTNDYNLNKVAQLAGVEIININDLANALKPVALPGEKLTVKILRPGQESGQGVGYLDDGTMVVVEGARDKIGEVLNINVTSALQTSAGRMVFGKVDDTVDPRHSREPAASR